jgi:GNAT superfamily N-acetyltransferase
VTVEYTTSLEGVAPEHLSGFFEGWPSPPSSERHLEILRGSYRAVLARDAGSPRVIGFVNAISDGVLSAFVPLLEVLPAHRERGIGTELVRRLLAELDHLYAIDLLCDPELQPFYERLGMHRAVGMAVRRPDRAAGR